MLDDRRRKYFAVREVAEYPGLARSTVYGLVGRKEIRAHKFGNAIGAYRDEIPRFERAQCILTP